ncbi:Bis(5'-nucleosyl)-tetraphosphatase, symmetrical [mine drainage metagenome]|uniref:Bis(5'-nucleosyl)-tetraphosphatase, symmetrical n=1 Tax=mine drainage metagenome TaxID=410659 RepID=A0A1J5PP72_9ZZZZ
MKLFKSLFRPGIAPIENRPAVVFGPPQPEFDLYVIGDVHGRVDLLNRLLARIEADINLSDGDGEHRIIFVGDYIDRGDDSAIALERIFSLAQNDPAHVVCLLGNHERMMLDFLDTPTKGPRWLRNGGLQTLMSLGLGGALAEGMTDEELVALSTDLHRALPDGVEDWLRTLPLFWHSGNVWAVHAGADPSLPMSDQPSRTLIWGHRDFFTVPRQDQQWVAHGHTVVDAGEAKDGRIAVDTGAVYTGRLSAARIQQGNVSFLVA